MIKEFSQSGDQGLVDVVAKEGLRHKWEFHFIGRKRGSVFRKVLWETFIT